MSENLSGAVAGIYFAAFLVDHVKLQKGMGGRIPPLPLCLCVLVHFIVTLA